ncbi:hypothetical protein niasHT_031991 [Heterodera trifolii]|uniref:Coatomer subunit gamma n=1 Tax=Heterodera trifolii TaxID=157864 RepID=A0ABD2I1C3_9BILA
MRRDKKDDESAAGNPYDHLDKATVVQETRAFNETPVNARKCRPILCKLLYLLQHGETIGKTEATDTFFAITKLWQAKDMTLRMLVYLAIKELCQMSSDVIIVTSSLTKDMTGREDVYRAPAIRALCRILNDTGMLQAIERYMKQAIVDKTASVSSAALVSSIHLMRKSPEEAVSADNHMVQFHALSLLVQVRANDRLAILKMVQKFSKSGLRSPLALCQLIRVAARLIAAEAEEHALGVDGGSAESRSAFTFIESCLRNKHEMVVYEAASAIVRLPRISSGELASAVSVLQLFLSSPKPTLRFAAVRTLNRISMDYPQAVISCNVDLEQLITDSNRSIATLAITTLLKTGAEASVERLMKQIGTFVSEISDEFKIVVIEAIRSLCHRYPRKHATLMNFLASMLRDEGGFDYKKAIVDTIITIVEDNPSAKDLGLSHLCEFIEDCEHAALATRVLHLLGREGPTTANPSRYIRFIYNRVILESTQVRAAAVTALAKFGAECAQLRPSILILLKRCLLDTDDEVRDRATFYLVVLRTEKPQLILKYILDTLKVSVVGLERALEQYTSSAHFDSPFDLKQVPLSTEPLTASTDEAKKKTALMDDASAAMKKQQEDKKKGPSRQEQFALQLSSMPEFAACGPLFKSCAAVELTETITEYNVSCVKHIFNDDFVLLQFDCRNTLNDQLLEEVFVEIEPQDEGEDCPWHVQSVRPLAQLPFGQPGTTYVLLKMPEDGRIAGTFGAKLKFKICDVDPTTGEPESNDLYDEVYALEPIDIGLVDFLLATAPKGASFTTAWDALKEEGHETEESYALSNVHTLEDAVSKLLKCTALFPCEHSNRVPEGKSSHQLLLCGAFRGGIDVLCRVRLVMDPSDQSVSMNMVVRSMDETISQMIANIVS